MSDVDSGQRGGLPRLTDDTPAEESIGQRDLTRWPTAAGRALVRLVGRLAAGVSAHTVLYTTLLVGLVIVTAFAAGGTAIYDAVAENDGISRLDQPALDQAIALRTAQNTEMATGFTHLGGPVGMTVLASLVTFLMVWRWRSRTPLVLMLIATAGSLLMTTIGKAIVGRPRPPLSEAVPPYEYAFSFPSGHTLNSTVIAGVVAYLLLRRLTTPWARTLTVVLAVVWAVVMGLSRVFLGHHWLTDVVFAWLLGSAWLALIITAHRLFLTIRRRRQDAP
ncbi:MAG TPA: phosphatase PAP2 family protein [Propionibacteriaceae bacterium]|nr:phosphatase PAP2 family protein [Propionibacteriaceae bacterium]